MKIDNMLNQQGIWLRGIGPESEIVISSRIRLARNFAGYPFVHKSSEQDKQNILKTFRKMVEKKFDPETVYYLELQSLSPTDCQYLLERHLISKELMVGKGASAVLIDRNENFSVMVNEEDHLRMQTMTSGFDLSTIWDRINKLDDVIESEIQYAYDERYGYLTACPSNVGTGIRVSVMLHLPGLVETREMDRVFRSLSKINLAVRGIYGEGSPSMGEFFQISNQVTLGRTEKELISQIQEVIPQIIDYEQKARHVLLEKDQKNLLDRCYRATGILNSARTITLDESMELLSRVRLGINMGLITDISITKVNDLLLHLQPAHLQKLAQKELEEEEEDAFRAEYLRKKLKESD